MIWVYKHANAAPWDATVDAIEYEDRGIIKTLRVSEASGEKGGEGGGREGGREVEAVLSNPFSFVKR